MGWAQGGSQMLGYGAMASPIPKPLSFTSARSLLCQDSFCKALLEQCPEGAASVSTFPS